MGKRSAIEWTDHTFNPVWGCVKLSPACDNCYAETFDHRLGGAHWGPHAPRREFGDKHWNEPLKWNREAEREGRRHRVFCASMADVFDNQWPQHVRPRLWKLIAATPMLDWLLLTKRPQNIARMLPTNWGSGWPNVWLGVTAENQEEANRRIPVILSIPAVVHFVSYEPALGPLDLHEAVTPVLGDARHVTIRETVPLIDWVIAGGESGHRARPANPDWFRSVRDQCAAAGAAFFMKQITDEKGRKIPRDRWPQHLNVRQYPLYWYRVNGSLAARAAFPLESYSPTHCLNRKDTATT
jgi:protein gp37